MSHHTSWANPEYFPNTRLNQTCETTVEQETIVVPVRVLKALRANMGGWACNGGQLSPLAKEVDELLGATRR